MDDLKPCPFCGPGPHAKPQLDREQRGPGYDDCLDDPDAYAYFVRCPCCACEGPWWKSQTGAIRGWNHRADATARNHERLLTAVEAVCEARGGKN